jgi:hypothetical protein
MKATTRKRRSWTYGGQKQEFIVEPWVMLTQREVELILQQLPSSPLRTYLLETFEDAKRQTQGNR